MEINVSSNIKDVTTDNFMSEVIEASKEKPIIVDFWAPWCEPCKQLGPLLEDAVKEQKDKITLAKIDIDQNQEIATQLRIQSIPTVYTFFEGKVVDGFQGAKTNSEILDFVKKSANLQFSDVREIVDALSTAIKESKPVVEALKSLEPSEKAFKAQENIEELEKQLQKDPNNLDSLQEMAVALYGKGDIATSFDLLLKSIEKDKEWNDQAARKQLIEFFTSAGFDASETINARRKLASLLFS